MSLIVLLTRKDYIKIKKMENKKNIQIEKEKEQAQCLTDIDNTTSQGLHC